MTFLFYNYSKNRFYFDIYIYIYIHTKSNLLQHWQPSVSRRVDDDLQAGAIHIELHWWGHTLRDICVGTVAGSKGRGGDLQT